MTDLETRVIRYLDDGGCYSSSVATALRTTVPVEERVSDTLWRAKVLNVLIRLKTEKLVCQAEPSDYWYLDAKGLDLAYQLRMEGEESNERKND